MMHNPEYSIKNLVALKKIGVQLSIDDFGTGYSSFTYLARFPVDEVKIDRSFLINLGETDNRIITEAIINLAHQLNLRVVAEGIESHEILTFVESKGCDMSQGFYICKPNPPEEIIDWLLRRDDLIHYGS